MKAENYVTLEFLSRSANEGFARMAAASFAAQLDPTLDEIGDIKTAVSEAVTNAIVHAYPDELGKIVMKLRILEGGVLELAEETGLTPEEIASVELATGAPESLQQETAEGLTLESTLGTDSPEERMVEHIALREAIDQLPEREKMTILLRFFKGLTQEQTARILGVSQVQISRLERRGLADLRRLLDG